jgi:hypothetical protein
MMGLKLFAFVGFYENTSEQDLILFQKKLNKRFQGKEIQIYFERKSALLLARFDEVSFYVSFSNNKNELEDWYQMSRDAEISSEGNPVDKESLLRRYDAIEGVLFNLYKKIHFDIGVEIIDEMENFNKMTVYSFQ